MTDANAKGKTMDATNMKRTHIGMVVTGTPFRLEVAQKDERGLHDGYGPGERIWTKQENETRWFSPQPIYVES